MIHVRSGFCCNRFASHTFLRTTVSVIGGDAEWSRSICGINDALFLVHIYNQNDSSDAVKECSSDCSLAITGTKLNECLHSCLLVPN